ncbi:MAG TPA: zeta toxin family protein, partial [Chitinophagaceae bacterium]
IMINRMDEMIEKDQSFAFETTLSGLAYLKLITKAKKRGYEVVLFFVYLASFELAQNRVAIRVSKGGHHIPDHVVERRYFKGQVNFSRYAAQVNSWYIYDNSETEYILIAKRVEGKEEIFNFDTYNQIINGEK